MSVSVVIATYNRARMAREAIESALAQTRPPDEIVVVDDASSDSTAAELNCLAALHPNLGVHRRASNSGGVIIWNEAVAKARGEFIAFCTDDDRFLPGHIEASLAYLENHPEVGLVHSGFIDSIECGAKVALEPRPLRSQVPLETNRKSLLRYMTRYYDWPFHPSTLVIRRELWERTGGFDPRYSLADTDWFVRAVEIAPAAMLPRHGVYNRRHRGNWSNRLGSARMQREIFEVVESLIERRYIRQPLRRAAWRAIWRANVRLHLGLTMIARLRSGHAEAACAAWHGVLQDTGRRAPEWLEGLGAHLAHRLCAARPTHELSPRETVIPL